MLVLGSGDLNCVSAIKSSRCWVNEEGNLSQHSVSGWFKLTLFRSKSTLITPSCPFNAAKESGVQPLLVFALSRLTSFCSTRIFTTPSYLFCAANKSGVQSPSVSASLRLTSFCSNSILTTPSRPHCAAPEKWPSAIIGVRVVGVDFLSFQKHLYYLLMSVLCRQRDGCPRGRG